jgi:stalled ribosome alternative rescue factor ArfA
MSNRNPYAKALKSGMFRKQVVKPLKGKGAYTRKSRNKIND